jgi:hypothetical protein
MPASCLLSPARFLLGSMKTEVGGIRHRGVRIERRSTPRQTILKLSGRVVPRAACCRCNAN